MKLVHSLSMALCLILASIPSLGRCDRLDQIEAKIKQLETLVSVADSTYYRPTISIKLPDRIGVDDKDYFTPIELAQLLRKNVLDKEIVDYITQVSLEFESGYFNLSSREQYWITNRQDEARKWWESIRIEKTAKNRALWGDNRAAYFIKKSRLLNDEDIPGPDIYVSKLQSEEWDIVASLLRMHKSGFTFHAPFMRRSHSKACSDSIVSYNGTGAPRENYRNKLKEGRVPEENINDLEDKCFNSQYAVWYAQQTAADYYHRILNDSPTNFVQSQLFLEGEGLSKDAVPKYYEDILVSALYDAKRYLNEAQRGQVDGATIAVSDDRFTNATSLFHAFTDTANKEILVSPVIIRAVAAQCRIHQVHARMLYDALKKERAAYIRLISGPRDGFIPDNKFGVSKIPSIQETEPITTISYDWEEFPEYPGPLDIDVDVVDSFNQCFKEQVVFLLSHELAHIYLPNASENARDCNVVKNLSGNENFLVGGILLNRGREFLSAIMFNAVTEQDFALWGWNESIARKIKKRFSELDNCLIK